MKRVIAIISLFFLVSCSNTINLQLQELNFVETHIATIATENSAVRYIMRYHLSDEAPEHLYAQIHYQVLSNQKLIHISTIGNIGSSKVLNFLSMPEKEIMNEQHFAIKLILFKDSDYRQTLGMHQDLIWFDMPETVAELLQIKLF